MPNGSATHQTLSRLRYSLNPILALSTRTGRFLALRGFLFNHEHVIALRTIKTGSQERERAVGRELARTEIARCLTISGKRPVTSDEVLLDSSPGEKPRFHLTRASEQIPAVDFSWSHSRGLVAAAAVTGKQVGVDVEKIREFLPATLKAFLTPREYARMSLLSGGAQRRSGTLAWCIKEAYLKAIGTGLRVHPRRIEIKETEAGALLLTHDGQPVHASVGWEERHGYIIAHVTLPLHG